LIQRHVTAAVWLENQIPVFTPTADQIRHLRALVPMTDLTVCRTRADFEQVLPKTEVALVWRFDDALAALAPNLRWLATPAAGREWIRLTAPPPELTITFGAFHGPLIAQTVAGYVLALNRGILDSQRLVLAGDPWPRNTLASGPLAMRDLSGTQAVILGFGAIGQAIGRCLKPFGVRIAGVRRTPAVRPDWFDACDGLHGVGDLPDLLRGCDHLILALPSDTGTDGLIDARLLACLPRHAAVYNIGRGNCLDETALIHALRTGKLRGACLDVFAHEPLPTGSPLLTTPNLFAMPHASAFAATYLDQAFVEFAAHFSQRYPAATAESSSPSY